MSRLSRGEAQSAGELEQFEDMPFQHLTWRLQRIAWVVLTALLAAALAGTFGDGPVSRARRTGDSVAIEYERFVRRGRPARMVVEISPGVQAAELKLAPDLATSLAVESLLPPPEHVVVSHQAVTLRFAADRPDRMQFILVFQQPGVWDSWVAVNDAAPVRFRQIVYP